MAARDISSRAVSSMSLIEIGLGMLDWRLAYLDRACSAHDLSRTPAPRYREKSAARARTPGAPSLRPGGTRAR